MQKSSLQIVYKKIAFTLFILVVYILGLGIPLPFAQMTAQYRHALATTSAGMIGALGGANLQHLSLFMVGLNPLMIAMLFIQIFMLTGIFAFDTLSVKQVAAVQQGITLILAIIQSAILAFGFHLTGSTWQSIGVIIILTAGSMFVIWLGNLNTIYGIGGTIIIILFNIITSAIPMVTRSVRDLRSLPHGEWWLVALVIFGLAVTAFWIAFSRVYYPLRTIQIELPSYERPIIVPIGLNLGAMMTVMVGMAIMSLPTLLASYYGQNTIFANAIFNIVFIGVVNFVLFYFFSFMIFNPKDQAKSYRNSNTYIPKIRPGKPTQRFLTRLLWTLLLPGAFLNTAQAIINFTGMHFWGKYAGFAVIPMSIMMVVLMLNGVREQMLIMFFPYRYERVAVKEIHK